MKPSFISFLIIPGSRNTKGPFGLLATDFCPSLAWANCLGLA